MGGKDNACVDYRRRSSRPPRGIARGRMGCVRLVTFGEPLLDPAIGAEPGDDVTVAFGA